MKNGGGHFAPKLGGHFELESGGHFKLELGGQYHWNLQENNVVRIISFSIDDIDGSRYSSIKLKFKNISEIPKWRFRKGKKNLLMIDEIELN